MDYPYIAFHITSETVIPWSGSISDLQDHDLGNLLQQCQTVFHLLQQESRTRKTTPRSRNSEQHVQEYFQRVLQTADNLKVLERLEVQAAKHVRTARKTLETQQTNKGYKIYQQFLMDIMRHCGPGLVLLCAAGLWKQRVANMTLAQRLTLLTRLREGHVVFSSAIFTELAQGYGITDMATPPRPLDPAGSPHATAVSREHHAPLRDEGGNVPSQRRIEYAYSQAPMDAISVLGQPLMDAIQSSHQWKWERELAVGRTTDCLTALAPENRTLDIAINVLVGWEKGT